MHLRFMAPPTGLLPVRATLASGSLRPDADAWLHPVRNDREGGELHPGEVTDVMTRKTANSSIRPGIPRRSPDSGREVRWRCPGAWAQADLSQRRGRVVSNVGPGKTCVRSGDAPHPMKLEPSPKEKPGA